GCNPAYSKSIHTWLRFGEIMRGSLSAEPYRIKTIRNKGYLFAPHAWDETTG
ncbi:hypothetical protein RCL16_00005, partial [Salmonella enterica subsp. enterica serovar 1,4,[5],12:i:-]